MKFEKLNLKILISSKSAIVITTAIMLLALVNGTSHGTNYLAKHKTSQNNDKSDYSLIPGKTNVKKSTVSNSAAYLKEHHEESSINAEKKNAGDELPTLDEIKKEQENRHTDTQNKPETKNLHYETQNKHHNEKATVSSIAKRVQDLSTNKSKNKNPATNYEYISSSSKSEGGFFSNTSKQNKNTAWESLGAFVAGIILFFVSIQLICWNERRAVKFTNFVDWASKDSNVVDLGEKTLNGDKPEDKAYIVNGNLKVTKEPVIDSKYFDQIIHNMGVENSHKLLFVKFSFDERKIISKNETGSARIDERGNEEQEVKVVRDWVSVPDRSNEKFGTKIYLGKANLSGVYNLNMDRIYSLVELSQYLPSHNDLSVVENHVASNTNNNPRYKVFLRDDAFYIIYSALNDNLSDDNFYVDHYEFNEHDRRLTLHYFKVDELNCKDNQFTLGGKLKKTENEMYQVTPYDSPIKQAEWNFYLCCFGETEENYKFDIVSKNALSKKEIIKNFEFENKACTWILRIFGFLLHFLAYYLILYPLINLIGMIPYLGAVGATFLILIAFLFACVTFLFIIAIAWTVARPLLAFLLFGAVAALIIISKMASDKYSTHQNQNGNSFDVEIAPARKMKFL